MDGAPSTVVMNSSERPPLIDVMPVANVAAAVGRPPRLPPIGAGHQLRHLRGAARAERRVGDLLGAHGAADHPRVDERRRRLRPARSPASPPISSCMSTRMLRPAFTRTPVLRDRLEAGQASR